MKTITLILNLSLVFACDVCVSCDTVTTITSFSFIYLTRFNYFKVGTKLTRIYSDPLQEVNMFQGYHSKLTKARMIGESFGCLGRSRAAILSQNG